MWNDSVLQIKLEDWSGESFDRYNVRIIITPSSINLALTRPGDKFPFASVDIDNERGVPMLRYWLTGDMDEEPTHTIELDQQIDRYCLKCGCAWDVHNGDGSCVEEES